MSLATSRRSPYVRPVRRVWYRVRCRCRLVYCCRLRWCHIRVRQCARAITGAAAVHVAAPGRVALRNTAIPLAMRTSSPCCRPPRPSPPPQDPGVGHAPDEPPTGRLNMFDGALRSHIRSRMLCAVASLCGACPRHAKSCAALKASFHRERFNRPKKSELRIVRQFNPKCLSLGTLRNHASEDSMSSKRSTSPQDFDF